MNFYIRRIATGFLFCLFLAIGFAPVAKASTITVNKPAVVSGDTQTPSTGSSKPTIENNIVEVPVAEPKPGRPVVTLLDPVVTPVDAEKKIPFLRRLKSYPPTRVFKVDK